MESIHLHLTTISPLSKPHKPLFFSSQTPLKPSFSLLTKPPIPTSKTLVKPYPYLPIFMPFLSNSPLLSSFASDIENPSGEISGKIDIESILLSIDGFFNKYPYFVFSVTFVWLIVIPLVEEYFKKFKFISALNGFKKLRDDSSAQLLDIRDDKSLAFLGSPNLKFLNKNVVNVVFNDGDVDGFLIKVKDLFDDPQNTVVCVVDNFDGNSIKVAELLVKNGFKEAYAIKSGLRGKKGWQEIQEELLPPSVHIFPKKKAKKSQKVNNAPNQSDSDQVQSATSEK